MIKIIRRNKNNSIFKAGNDFHQDFTILSGTFGFLSQFFHPHSDPHPLPHLKLLKFFSNYTLVHTHLSRLHQCPKKSLHWHWHTILVRDLRELTYISLRSQKKNISSHFSLRPSYRYLSIAMLCFGITVRIFMLNALWTSSTLCQTKFKVVCYWCKKDV